MVKKSAQELKIITGNKISKKRYSSSQDPFYFRVEEEPVIHKSPKHFSVFYYDPEYSIKLIQSDCIDTLKLVSPDSVDMIFADPPYFRSN
jgi:hypothetical protein